MQLCRLAKSSLSRYESQSTVVLANDSLELRNFNFAVAPLSVLSICVHYFIGFGIFKFV